MIRFGNKLIALLFDGQVFFFVFRLPVLYQINQDGPSFSVKRQGMLEITLTHHISGFYSTEIFHGLIPGDNGAFIIDDDGWIRKEVDDLG